LPDQSARIQHIGALYPHQVNSDNYTLPAFPGASEGLAADGLPIPPTPFWASYCTTADSYIQSGADDVSTMRKLLAEAGAPLEDAGRILEIGVAGGRMIRHLTDLTEAAIWGVDPWSSAILWCKEFLSPPFNFATTTIAPHLPFEDRYFDLVYAGSVWTHLDDLADAWALEAWRILRPGGHLYFSINDRSAVKIFEGGGSIEDRQRYIERVRPDGWREWLERLARTPEYQSFASGKAQMVTMGRSTQANVMWDVDYLLQRWAPMWRTVSAWIHHGSIRGLVEKNSEPV
jgi:SAM-dependent methyltransferase